MRPVFQTRISAGVGNCFAACIASVLEIDINAVPWPKPGELSDQMDAWNGYMQRVQDAVLSPRGMSLLTVRNDSPLAISGYALHGVRTAAGFMHSVVTLDGEIVHDPYPGGSEIVEHVDYTVFYLLDAAQR